MDNQVQSLIVPTEGEAEDPFQRYGLSEIHLSDKSTFEGFLPAPGLTISDYMFTNVYAWRNPIHLRWNVLHDCLCVYANGDGGLTLILPPFGKGDFEKALADSTSICDEYNQRASYQQPLRIEYIDVVLRDKFQHLCIDKMGFDYVYETVKMIDLPGGRLASKRQMKNRFLRRYPDARTEVLEDRHLEDCYTMTRLWQEQSEAKADVRTSVDIKRSKEIEATFEMIRSYKELSLQGMVLYVGPKIVGFTLGEYMGDDVCSILVEKTDRSYTGAANYIFSEFCRQFWSKTRWCNVGDDWDVKSLAWTKQSYDPAFRLEKFVAKFPARNCVD